METVRINEHDEEIEFYRRNHAEMEKEIRTLIADNQKLSQQVASLLKEKLDNVRQTQMNGHNELEELKKQVSLLAKERDSLHVLWQTAQKTIEALETELKTYQHDQTDGSKQLSNKELQFKLDTAITDYVELESKTKQIQSQFHNLQNKLKYTENDILTYKERGKELQAKIEELSKELEEHKINLAVEKKNNEILKEQLVNIHKECATRTKREAEAKSKVAEALQLFDVVTSQKNEALKRIQDLTGELNGVKHTLSNVERNVKTAFRKELDDVKEKYNDKIVDMLQHIKNLDSELAEKGVLLNKALREVKIVHAANEEYLKEQKDNIKAINPKLKIAEQKLETMFQELVMSERRNIQVVCEKQCLAIDLQRTQDLHAREIKRRDWEEQLLRTQCDELKVQIEHLQKSLEETHEMVNKLQHMLTSRDEINQKVVAAKETELKELNKHLENYMDLNKKWKQSYIEMADKLKHNLKLLEAENKELRNKLKLPTNGSLVSNESSSS